MFPLPRYSGKLQPTLAFTSFEGSGQFAVRSSLFLDCVMSVGMDFATAAQIANIGADLVIITGGVIALVGLSDRRRRKALILFIKSWFTLEDLSE
jgi:hypothetical protein